MTIDEAIDPRAFYTPRQIQALLGIDERTVREAGRRGVFKVSRANFENPRYEVSGGSLLVWIQAENIACPALASNDATQPEAQPTAKRGKAK